MNRARPRKPLEIAFWVAGVAMLSFCFGEWFVGESRRGQAINDPVEARMSSGVHADFVTPNLTGWQDFEPLPVVPAPERTSSSLPAGLLRIYRSGLEVPVYVHTTETNADPGAGGAGATAVSDDGGNSASAAHRDAHSGVSQSVAVGAVLEFERSTERRLYRVAKISIIEPDDPLSAAAIETAAVTLPGCYPFYLVGHVP